MSTNSDPRPTMSGKIIAIAAVLVAIAAVFVFWNYYQSTRTHSVSATPAGFSRPEGDDHTLLLNVDVTRKNTDVPTYCIVQAQNYNVEEVGRREFVIPAGGPSVQRFTVEIPSRDVPVAGKVYGCAENPPSYLTNAEVR